MYTLMKTACRTKEFEITEGQLVFFPESKASSHGDNMWLKDTQSTFHEDPDEHAYLGYATSTLAFSTVPPPIWSSFAESYSNLGCCQDPDEDRMSCRASMKEIRI